MPSSERHDPLTIKRQADSKRAVKDCDIQVGDAVLLRQPKQEKLSMLHCLTLFTVPRKHHSMLTEESADEVTRNIISLQEASGWWLNYTHNQSSTQGRGNWPGHQEQPFFLPSSLSWSIHRLTSGPWWKRWDPDWTCASKVCSCLCAPKETHPGDLINDNSLSESDLNNCRNRDV